MIYYRTCQECLNVQVDVDPDAIAHARREAYMARKCKKCGSRALDYGSPSDPRKPENDDAD